MICVYGTQVVKFGYMKCICDSSTFMIRIHSTFTQIKKIFLDTKSKDSKSKNKQMELHETKKLPHREKKPVK